VPPSLIEGARAGQEPTTILRLPSGWVFLHAQQFLRGYCLLCADPPLPSINDCDPATRAQFLADMVTVGDALLEVTHACRINYFIAGNFNPVLHAHIVPRYLTEPDLYRKGPPWSYPQETMDSIDFDPHRDADLMNSIRKAIQSRL